MESVQSFLANPADFAKGLEALRQISPKSKNLPFYASNPVAAPGGLHFNLLLNELRNAWRIHINKVELSPPEQKQAKLIEAKKLQVHKNVIYDGDFVDVKSLPPDMQKLYLRNQQITRDVAGLHQELKISTTNKKRLAAARKLKELDSERKANWKVIDKFIADKSGK